MEKIERNTELAESMRSMQKACRVYLDYAEHENKYSEDVLNDFRAVFVGNMLKIATNYNFSIESEFDDWGDDESRWIEAYKQRWGTGQYKLVK